MFTMSFPKYFLKTKVHSAVIRLTMVLMFFLFLHLNMYGDSLKMA